MAGPTAPLPPYSGTSFPSLTVFPHLSTAKLISPWLFPGYHLKCRPPLFSIHCFHTSQYFNQYLIFPLSWILRQDLKPSVSLYLCSCVYICIRGFKFSIYLPEFLPSFLRVLPAFILSHFCHLCLSHSSYQLPQSSPLILFLFILICLD